MRHRMPIVFWAQIYEKKTVTEGLQKCFFAGISLLFHRIFFLFYVCSEILDFDLWIWDIFYTFATD